MHPSKIITVLVADDHPLALEGVRSMLNKAADIKIVGEAQDGNEIKPLVAKLRPRILLLDLRMPNLSPIELEKWVRENYPETVTLAFTAHHHVAYLAGMMDAGAVGYLDKKLKGNDLLASIRRAASGESLFTQEQFTRAKNWRQEAGEKWEKLTEREREVLLLMEQGLSNKAIAKQLGVTLKTVAYHVSAIFDRLDVESRHEAIAWYQKYFPKDPE